MTLKRADKILKLIIENYIDLAEPIGSKFLVNKYDLGISAATVRNVMNDLEKQDLLTHPHTSAGRIPTEKGFQYYLDNLLNKNRLSKKFLQQIQSYWQNKKINKINKWKQTAKFLSQELNTAVILIFNNNFIYYTGFSLLFSQPEFTDKKHLLNFSLVFDRLEEEVEFFYNNFTNSEIKIYLGHNNPLSSDCGLVGLKILELILVVLGPLRMPYNRTMSYLNSLKIIK